MPDHSYGPLFCPSTAESAVPVMVVSDLDNIAVPTLWLIDPSQSLGLASDKVVAVISCNLICLIPPSFCRKIPVCLLMVLSHSSRIKNSSTLTKPLFGH